MVITVNVIFIHSYTLMLAEELKMFPNILLLSYCKSNTLSFLGMKPKGLRWQRDFHVIVQLLLDFLNTCMDMNFLWKKKASLRKINLNKEECCP